MFSHNGANGPESKTMLNFVKFARWQHRLDVRQRYVWSSCQMAALGAELLYTIACLIAVRLDYCYLSTPHVGLRYPLSCLFSSLVHSLPHLLLFFTFSFSFSCLLYLFSFVHPFPFYQNSHRSVSRLEIVGGYRTWV